MTCISQKVTQGHNVSHKYNKTVHMQRCEIGGDRADTEFVAHKRCTAMC